MKQFFLKTFLAVQAENQPDTAHKSGSVDSDGVALENLVALALESLTELGHVKQKGNKAACDTAIKIEITALGQATFKGKQVVNLWCVRYKHQTFFRNVLSLQN